MKNTLQNLKKEIKGNTLLKYFCAALIAFSVSSCYAPLSSSKMPKSARKKLHTHNHRKATAAKWGVLDKSVDCPSSSRRKEKY